jgi:hypothetical protein
MVSAMVDVMSRFDAHGNVLGRSAPSAAPTLSLSPTDKSPNWLNNGILGSLGKVS